MKQIIIILLILFIFCFCASVGYELATRAAPELKITGIEQQPTAEAVSGIGGEQHNVIVIQVDQLDSQGPRLESVWFVSVFFMEEVPPTVTFVQLYSPYAVSEKARALERAFSLNVGGEPVDTFWKALRDFDIDFEGYFLVDRFSTQRILEWSNGEGDYVGSLLTAESQHALVQQTCQSISGISLRETNPFDWTGLAPKHFRSDLRMEKASKYWTKLTSSKQAMRCDLIITP